MSVEQVLHGDEPREFPGPIRPRSSNSSEALSFERTAFHYKKSPSRVLRMVSIRLKEDCERQNAAERK